LLGRQRSSRAFRGVERETYVDTRYLHRVSELFAPVCSIAPTKRRRFLWAAWWTAPPSREPFREPDASRGGARTHDEALREAEKAAGRALVEIEPRWARAWSRVLVGEPPWSSRATPDAVRPRPEATPEGASLWTILGVLPNATVPEIKRAFRQRAIETHPDQGGDAEAFRALRSAYARALLRREKDAKKPKKKR
jgi:hypothetical protein